MEGLQNFTAFKYKTIDGENIVATKNNGVVTLVGDKNGVRQMPLDTFMKELVETLPKVELEKTPKTDSVSFSCVEKADEKNQNLKKEASTAKKWGVGIASCVIPGLGQLINGDVAKGAGFFCGATALGALTYVGCPYLVIPSLGLGIWSIVDAVKNAKSN